MVNVLVLCVGGISSVECGPVCAMTGAVGAPAAASPMFAPRPGVAVFTLHPEEEGTAALAPSYGECYEEAADCRRRGTRPARFPAQGRTRGGAGCPPCPVPRRRCAGPRGVGAPPRAGGRARGPLGQLLPRAHARTPRA